MRGQQTLWTEFGKSGTPSLFDNAVSFEDAAGTVTPIEVTVKDERVEDAWRELAAEIEANESETRYDAEAQEAGERYADEHEGNPSGGRYF